MKNVIRLKNKGTFPETLEIWRDDVKIPLDGIIGIEVSILPSEPARVKFEYLLGELDIQAKEKQTEKESK